jgi:hypothetical protein
VFLKGKQTCVTKIGNKWKGSTELIGKLYLTSSNQSTEVSCLSDEIQFRKKDNANGKIIIPYNKNIPTTFNSNWKTYLSKIPKWLCQSSTKTYPEGTFYSIFNFYNVAYSGQAYLKVRIAS